MSRRVGDVDPARGSARRGPQIKPADLRDDLASEERVERIWGRLEQDLVTLRARPPARPSRTVVWALAATFAAFGVGLVTGRIVWKERPVGTAAVVATNDRATVDVFAAGTQERTYSLPGGGTVTLQPGSMIELERSGGSDVRLRLLSGEASLDTGQSADQALAIVSGDATVAATPGTTVRVRQSADNLDVRVAAGSAQVSSPAGTRALGKGDRWEDVPTRTASASNDSPVARTSPIHTGRLPRGESTAAAVAVAPSWREQYQAGNFDDAIESLKQSGGFAAAVASSKSADDLMAISDLASYRGGDAGAAMTAKKRVADEFGATLNGSIAATQLCKVYGAGGQADLAKKYCDQAAASKSVFAEDVVCDTMRKENATGHKDEAAKRAAEYLSRYPNGRCKDEAARIKAGGDASEDGDSPQPGEPAPSSTVSALKPPASATASASTSAAPAPTQKP